LELPFDYAVPHKMSMKSQRLVQSPRASYVMSMAENNKITQYSGKQFTVDGHDINVLIEPDDRLNAILGVIGGAKVSLRMFSYMFGNDATGEEVLAALTAAARRGVAVYLIIDSFGSGDTPHEFFAPLTDAGGHYLCFNSRWNFGYFVRNHQKILIADDSRAVIGGFNITDHYFGRKGNESWQDFGVIITGDKVSLLGTYYNQLWEISGGDGIHYRKLRRLIKSWSGQDGTIRWLIGGPTNRMSPWALQLKRDLTLAHSVDVVSAYFSPSQSVLRRLSKVTRKGTSRIILAGKTDNRATIGAARSLYKYLLKRGAKLYEFTPLPLHMKMLVIDDACYIGSSNLDVRSLFINMEIMLRIEDASLAQHLRSIVSDMAEKSEIQTLENHKKRAGWLHRMLWFGKYLLVNTVDYTVGRRIKFGLVKNK
jgi:cardiolipin synthase A/B